MNTSLTKLSVYLILHDFIVAAKIMPGRT